MADSDYEIIDPRFRQRIRTSAGVERLYSDCRWTEGPVYFPAHRYLVWSDIPNDRMLRWDETTGAVSVFRAPANFANGNCVDRDGRLVTCEQGTRRVARTEHDGKQTLVADAFDGKRLNSPNDVVVKSDGSVWFTDPTYGIDSFYEGVRSTSEIGASLVFRAGKAGDELTVVADDFVQPNGLAFSPDERYLYVADTGASHVEGHPRHIRRFELAADGKSLTSGAAFAECRNGVFDGFRLDEDGYLWSSAADGVHCFSPEGELLGIVKVPERVANVCFGGVRRNRLFICATTSLYSVLLPVRGAQTIG